MALQGRWPSKSVTVNDRVLLCIYYRENSASIQIVNDIEAEGVAYREEFLIEQEQLKQVSVMHITHG